MTLLVQEGFALGFVIFFVVIVIFLVVKKNFLNLNAFVKQGVIISAIVFLILRLLNYFLMLEQSNGEILYHEANGSMLEIDLAIALMLGFGFSYLKGRVAGK